MTWFPVGKKIDVCKVDSFDLHSFSMSLGEMYAFTCCILQTSFFFPKKIGDLVVLNMYTY